MSSCCDKKSRIHERPLGVKVSSVSKVLRFIEKTNNIQIFHVFIRLHVGSPCVDTYVKTHKSC